MRVAAREEVLQPICLTGEHGEVVTEFLRLKSGGVQANPGLESVACAETKRDHLGLAITKEKFLGEAAESCVGHDSGPCHVFSSTS